MSIKENIKKIPTQVKDHWVRNKDGYKNSAIIALSVTTAATVTILKAVYRTQAEYLESRSLTDDYKEYLATYEDDE